MSITTQNSLFVGFVMANDFTNTQFAIDANSWALIDNVILLSAGVPTTALPNNSFENWEDVTIENPTN